MTSEQAIKDRAKQIDPCAFKSYSGPARRDAQNAALEQARRELEHEPREQRRYTLDDIDRMRVAIRRVQPFNNPMNQRPGVPSVEDQLRTAMLGGVNPQELEDKADEHWARTREHREARRAADAAAYVMHHAPPDAEAVVADAPLNSYWRRVIVSRIEAILSRIGGGKI